MSDERQTVILGDRRYAVHRKWARPPESESFGFLSDLMVDGEGRVHVAQRGSDQPVLVFERDGRLAGAWGEGTLAEPHYINAAPDGSILVADRDAHQILRFDTDRQVAAGAGQAALALARRAVQPSDRGGAGARRRDLRRRRLRQFERPPLRRRRQPDRHLGRAGHGPGRLHHAACHLDRPLRPGAGRRPREQPGAGVRPRRRLPRRMGRLLSSDADLGRRPRPGVRHRPDPAHQPADGSTASWSAAAAARSTARTACAATPRAISTWPSCRRRKSPSSSASTETPSRSTGRPPGPARRATAPCPACAGPGTCPRRGGRRCPERPDRSGRGAARGRSRGRGAGWWRSAP